MKLNLRLFLAAAIALSVSTMSCKKTDDNNNNNGNTDLATHSNDQSRVSSGTDDVADDANSLIDNYPAFNGRPGNAAAFLPLPCNAVAVVDSTATLKRITVTYNGANCFGNRIRTGVVVYSMLRTQHWGDQGAVLNIESQNLRITRVSDGKSILINGTSTITNQTGGHLYNLASVSPIVHVIASPGVTVTFDDNSTRNWQIAKRRVFTYNNGIVITTTGNHTEGTNTEISEWGTNRFGNAFTASITEPMVIRQDCNFRLVSGQILNEGTQGTVEATFGLDATGIPTGCPGLGAYYFKAVWTGSNGNSVTLIYPY